MCKKAWLISISAVKNENPLAATRGFSIPFQRRLRPQADYRLLSIQPSTNIVTYYACREGDHKWYYQFHISAPPSFYQYGGGSACIIMPL